MMPRARSILLVFVGGAVGAGLREAIVLATPVAGGVPWAILAINLAGSLLLGLLLGALPARDAESPRQRDVRLCVGTGMIGGFTTYSAVAVDTVTLFADNPAIGLAYGVGSLLGGLACAAAGLALAGARR